MLGLKIVRSSYISGLKNDLEEYTSRFLRLRDELSDLKKINHELNDTIEFLRKSIDEKDAHIIKMGGELSKSRDLYNESVKEKESLKRAYMELDQKNKISVRLLEEAKRKYDLCHDREKYLKEEVDKLTKKLKSRRKVEIKEEDPNSGHVDDPKEAEEQFNDKEYKKNLVENLDMVVDINDPNINEIKENTSDVSEVVGIEVGDDNKAVDTVPSLNEGQKKKRKKKKS